MLLWLSKIVGIRRQILTSSSPSSALGCGRLHKPLLLAYIRGTVFKAEKGYIGAIIELLEKPTQLQIMIWIKKNIKPHMCTIGHYGVVNLCVSVSFSSV